MTFYIPSLILSLLEWLFWTFGIILFIFLKWCQTMDLLIFSDHFTLCSFYIIIFMIGCDFWSPIISPFASDVHGPASNHEPGPSHSLWLWPGLRFWKAKAAGSGYGFGKWCALENENKILIIFQSLVAILRLVCQTRKSDDENSVTFTKSLHMPHASTAFCKHHKVQNLRQSHKYQVDCGLVSTHYSFGMAMLIWQNSFSWPAWGYKGKH